MTNREGVDFFPVLGIVATGDGEDLLSTGVFGNALESLVEDGLGAKIREGNGAEESGEAVGGDFVVAESVEKVLALEVGNGEVGRGEDGEALIGSEVGDELVLLLGFGSGGKRSSRGEFRTFAT